MRILLFTTLLFSFIHESNAQNTVLKYTYSKENVVASKLIGTWKLDIAASTLLTKSEDRDQLDLRDKKQKKDRDKQPISEMQLEFTLDTTILVTIPDEYNSIFENKPIYAAGIVTLKDKKFPYILVEHFGNMQVVWFRERDGKAMGDTESFIVTIATAKDKVNDILYMGGDFNNQPFKAFKRIK